MSPRLRIFMYFEHTFMCHLIVIIIHNFQERSIVLNVTKQYTSNALAWRNFAFSSQDTHFMRQNSTISCPITRTSDSPRNTYFSRDSRLHFVSEVASEDLREDMTEEASFPQIAPVDRARSIGAGRRFIEIPSRVEQRRSPRLEFQFRPPTDDIVPLNDYEYA